MECQMNKDEGMLLRMLEYDIHIGLVHGIENIKKAVSTETMLEPKTFLSCFISLTNSISIYGMYFNSEVNPVFFHKDIGFPTISLYNRFILFKSILSPNFLVSINNTYI